jgi:hypothetical protein
MLIARDEGPSQVDAAHRAKLAYIYVRQSTAGQVRQHQESTTLQYRLVDRAAGLGWPRERIVVIDDDLGKSGTASAERQGFQRLIAEIGLGKAGLVLSLDASRLARNNRDWHQFPSVPMTMRHRPHASLDLGTGERHRGYAQHRWPNQRGEGCQHYAVRQTEDSPGTVCSVARTVTSAPDVLRGGQAAHPGRDRPRH